MDETWDVIIVGAGSAGIPAAIFAGQRGARVLLIEKAGRIGGTLHWSTGQMSAAGTKLQKKLGIEDHADWHYEDCQRVVANSIDPTLGRLAVDNAADTIDWLMDNGFEPDPITPVAGWAHEPYRVRRYLWGENQAISILEVMQPLLDHEIGRGTVTLSLQTTMTGLAVEDGAVTGVHVAARDGTAATVRAPNVVLTTGGYAANPELWAELTPYPLHSYCSPTSRGEGIIAAREIGAEVSGGEKFLCTFAGVPNDDDPLATRVGLALNTQFRMPWEIYVNRDGKRFVREDHPSIDHKEHALLKQDGMEMFIVFDEGIRQNAPHIDNEVDRNAMAQLFGNHVSYLKGDTLDELAAACAIDAGKLKETVRQYNEAVETGSDPAFGREVFARPIDTPPYLAIRAVGCTVVSPAGLAADASLRVLDTGGAPIPGLYAAGETLGFARLSGAGFVGGMSLTPALTFGRLLGQKILTWEGARQAAE